MHARLATLHLFSPERPAAKTMLPRTAVGTPVVSTASPLRVATRFGPSIDVRNRGVLKIARPAIATAALQHLAVVRIWNGDSCREMTVHDARVFAAQLMAAASHAENQNVLPDAVEAEDI